MIINGNSLEVLQSMKSDSIDMCLTSPPYLGLRDYGVEGQLGLEPTPELYIEHMTEVFREVKRVLKDEGTLWLNIGDTYNSRISGNPSSTGITKEQSLTPRDEIDLPSKCLCMIPERLAWSLIEDGWILRNKICWYKPNGMPSPVKDRFGNKWEYVFLFSKNNKTLLWQHKKTGEWVHKQPPGTQGSEGIDWEWKEDKKVSLWYGFTYYFDLDAVKNPVAVSTIGRGKVDFGGAKGREYQPDKNDPNYNGVNPGDVFQIPSATRTMGAILGVQGAVKVPGGKGWTGHPEGGGNACQKDSRWCPPEGPNPGDFWQIPTQPFPEAHFAVFPERLCEKPIKAGCPEGGIVLDPFCGAGTVGVVAKEQGKQFIGIDIKYEYCKMAKRRIAQVSYQLNFEELIHEPAY